MLKRPIVIAEDYWANSHFSIARYYGKIQFNGAHYVIVNKQGITIFELSNPKNKHYVGADNMAIPPGEPADLVLMEWVPIYKALGRNEFIKLLQQNDITFDKAIAYVKKKKAEDK